MSRSETSNNHCLFMGNIYEVNVGMFSKQKIDTVILKKMLSQIEAMFSHHNKLIIARFDLHPNGYTSNNTFIGRFFEKVKDSAMRHYKITRIGYVWVREQEKAKAQHYHCFVILDGNKVKNPHHLMEFIKKRWLFTSDGSVHIPERYIYKMARDGDTEEIGEMIYRVSYLAKSRGKGQQAKTARDFSTSRIKTKQRAEK